MAQLGKKLCSHLGGISLFFLLPLPITYDNVIGRENLNMLHGVNLEMKNGMFVVGISNASTDEDANWCPKHLEELPQ